MYKIAICDDDRIYIRQIRELIEQNAAKIYDEMSIQEFSKGEDLCKHISECDVDLIFLDIEMGGLNGVEVGHFIRDTLDNQTVQIVYVTGADGYDRQLFDVQPLNFLEKPIKEDHFARCLLQGYEKYTNVGNLFSYSNSYEKKVLPQREITAFVKKNKDVEIYTNHRGNDYFRGTMREVEERLTGYNFVKISQSVIINMNYIKNMGNKRVVMTDGKEYAISRECLSELRKRYCKLAVHLQM